MKKLFALALALVLVSVISLGGASTASAKGKDAQPINLQTALAVTGIVGLETNENSGWSKIEAESLQGLGLIGVLQGPAELNGLVLTAQQSSHEQFSTDILPFATVSKGKSKGTFYMTSPFTGATAVVGEYKIKLSNTPECQILGQGKWKAVDGIIDGGGDITVCTNWSWDYGTFITLVSVTGSGALVD